MFCLTSNVQANFCGTQGFLNSLKNNSTKTSTYLFEKRSLSLDNVPARRYKTEHFVITYTLAGVHRVRLHNQEEVDLSLQAEDIYRLNNPYLLQVYYDTLKAPHPVLVLSYATNFEMAYSYYVDSLKMTKPISNGVSNFFKTPKIEGLYHIEIAHISETGFSNGGTYGLAIPTEDEYSSGIIVENDFFYSSIPSGEFRPIIVSYLNEDNEVTYINYTQEWEKGSKITAVHEFYHSVQFEYTPQPISDHYNYWYELSSTGMEERLAFEVNDYLQYLGRLFREHSKYSLNTVQINSNTYGNGIFYQYLNSVLGDHFDIPIWEGISRGLDIDDALKQGLLSQGVSLGEVYANYTRYLPFSRGLLSKFGFFEPFNLDQNIFWPKINFLNFTEQNKLVLLLPPLSYEVLDLTESSNSNLLINIEDSIGITFVYADHWNTEIKMSKFLIPANELPKYIVMSNIKTSSTVNIKIDRNFFIMFPISIVDTQLTVSFELDLSNSNVTVDIFNEYVDSIGSFEITESDKRWDITLNGSRLDHGIYLYKIDGFPYLPFVLKP